MNKTLHLQEVPYSPDSCELFEHLRDLPHAVLLDSAFPHSVAGRYDVLAAAPGLTLPAPPASADKAEMRRWFRALDSALRERFGEIQPASQDIPFCGGAIGLLDYEAGQGLNHVSSHREKAGAAQVGLYDWCVIQDHLLKRATLVAQATVSEATLHDLLRRLRQRGSSPGAPAFRLLSRFESNLSETSYRAAFERIQAYIHAGDCYQVNLAQRFEAAYEGDPWPLYRRLRRAAAAPFSAYLALPGENEALLSLSPERFISLHGRHVETAPIKGTRPRFEDLETDRLAIRELRNSVKDRAENLMIVDLLRNDMSRISEIGSVKVPELYTIESYATVYQLTSTIRSQMIAGTSLAEVFEALFPCGSVTGAPKIMAMSVINRLEAAARNVYCGSIGWIAPDGAMEFNVAIRTLTCFEDGKVRLNVGGGIVHDSEGADEYAEALLKARFADLS